MGPSDIPSHHPALQILLADASNCPIITSKASEADRAHVEHLTSLFTSAQDTAVRLGLGNLKRITIQGGGKGSGVIQSSISPSSQPQCATKKKRKASEEPASNPADQIGVEPASGKEIPPAMFATIVTSSRKDGDEAREVLRELETIGKALQDEWEAESKREASEVQNLEAESSASE
jgi:hypothetical protein